MQDNCNLDYTKNQGNQINAEIKDKFTPKKYENDKLAASYKRLQLDNRSARVSDCGTFLEYHLFTGIDTKAKLSNANFCKDRLCPMCNWRRSLKIFGQVSQIMDKLDKHYNFIFATLTIKNCTAEELPSVVVQLQKAFNELTRLKIVKNAYKGYFKALEVTRNSETNTYHPHLHIIFAVRPSYFTDTNIYLSQKKLSELWQKSLKVDYIPMTDIRKVSDTTNNIKGVVAEVAKYSVKSSDYLNHNDSQNIDEIVKTLLDSLTYRRLCSFGGCFKDAREELQLGDPIEGDLIHTDNSDDVRKDLEYIIVRFTWKIGFGYRLMNIENYD
jgi:plasmid rolling circle replication initiator protein Rep